MQNLKTPSQPFPLTHVAVAFAVGVLCGLLWPHVNRFLNQPLSVPPYAFEGKCTKIVDADTFIVASKLDGDYLVHLRAAQALRPGEKNYNQALQFTTKTLLNQEVTVQPTYGVKSGEIHAWVYLESRCFNTEIIKAGYATDTNAF